MWQYTKGFFITVVFCICVFSVGYGQNSKFTMDVSSTIVEEGETFTLDVVLENLEAKNLKLPEIQNFKIVQGPSTSTSLSIINGRRSSALSYSYLVLATKSGKFTIPPATVSIGSKILKSNALNIEVVKSKPASKSTPITENSDLFIRVEADSDVAYLGQQVIVSLVLYTRQNVESYNILNNLDGDGFFIESIRNLRDPGQRKNVNGKEYYVQTLARWSAFPQKIGKFTFDPISSNFDILTEDGRSNSFFFRDTKLITLKSNRLTINVKPLPKPMPESFSGAVGNYQMSASISKQDPSIGESITLRMTVAGDGDSKTVQPPKFSIPEVFEKYDPVIKDESLNHQGQKVVFSKKFEYLIVPNKDTISEIIPEFTYFDPRTAKYETIFSPKITIKVNKGDGSKNLATIAEVKENSHSLKISDDLTLYNIKKPFFGSANYFIILSLIGSLFLGGYLFLRSRENKNKALEEHAKKDITVAKKLLSHANHFKNEGNVQEFYKSISEAIFNYIQNKYKIQTVDFDEEKVTSILQVKGFSKEIISNFEGIKQACYLAKFAGVKGDMEKIYFDAEKLIESI